MVKGNPPIGKHVKSVLNFRCKVEEKNGLSYRYALIHVIRIRRLIIMRSRRKYIYGPQRKGTGCEGIHVLDQSHSPLQRTSLRESGGQLVVDALH